VNRNLRFVSSVAKKYQNRGLPLSDLIGEGNVGLLTAARRFDPAQGVRFISYAVWAIRQAIRPAIARQSRIVRIPASCSAEVARINRQADVLRQRLAREPTLREIADASGAPLDPVWSDGARVVRDVSLDAPLEPDGEQTLLDLYSSDSDSDQDRDSAISMLGDCLERALSILPERDAKILRLHFGLEGGRDCSLEAIGKLLGITRERVRQIRDRALRRLREAESAREPDGFFGIPLGRESPELRCGRPRHLACRPPDRRM